jgi:hypothetical protein
MNTPREIIGAAIDDDVMMYGAADANADVIIAALNGAGYVIVPKVPTEQMAARGSEAWSSKPQNSPTSRWTTAVKRVYVAMVGAA